MAFDTAAQWDRLIELIEASAAAETVCALADPGLVALERRLGLGDASRVALFGESVLPYRSLFLSYFRRLRGIAEKERAAEEGLEETAGFGDAPARRAEENKRVPGITRIARIVAEITDPAPKVLPGDRMSPYERIERHIRFDNADRVAVAPLLGFHTARAGGITVREFMTDGRKAARAARRTWDIYGGFDMMPFNFPMGYLFPFVPETHSRFCSRWVLPECDELPKMDEQQLISDYDTVLREGCITIVRTEGGRLIRELRGMLPELGAFAAGIAGTFPRPDLYYPYAAGIINHPADLLSMWIGFERFMMDCASDPLKVREACERLAPGLVEMGLFSCRAAGIRQVLYGGSRMSGSFISRKMFDSLFAGVFRDQIWHAHREGFKIVLHLDNDYTKMLDFFLELPRHAGFLHLDQTDMSAAKKMLHGHLCLMGNLHPGLLAAGSPEQVTARCEQIIKEVGAGGGFILASACEVPIDTPVENLKAAKNAVDRWGWY